MKSPESIYATAWSPYSKTIAICRGNHPQIVEILDAVTFVPVTILEFPMGDQGRSKWLIFSPNGHLLTWLGSTIGKIITWDIQTGVVVSSISAEQWKASLQSSSVTYSACGTMFGVLFHNSTGYTLCTYNALSGTQISTHPVKGPISGNIWTCDECLRFATMGTGSVTIWEVGFVSIHTPTEIETHSIPDGLNNPRIFLFHPTFSQLAIKKEKRMCVWSIQDSKFLLDSVVPNSWDITFSPSGQFLAYITWTPPSSSREIILWKKSHTGYILHKRLTSNLKVTKPLISPDGGSIIAVGLEAIQLWHTKDSSTLLPTKSQNPNHFIVEFSPDQVFVAMVRLEDEIITVLDVKSGIPRLLINTSMGVYGLGITGNSIVAIGDGKIVTWDLPMGDHILNLRVDITNSVQTVTFNHTQFNNEGIPAALVSPNLHHIIVKDRYLGGDQWTDKDSYALYLYDIPTGRHLGFMPVDHNATPWFTLDGCEVWCLQSGGIKRWKIIEDSESNLIRLEYLGLSWGQPDGSPWQSLYSYQLVDDQWILNSSGKRLLWLPPHWRLHRSSWPLGQLQQRRTYDWRLRNRTWCSQFLALLHDELSEAVILELK